MTAKQLAYQERRRLLSAEHKAQGFAPTPHGSVSMADYLKLADELNVWRNRALNAESRLKGSGDVLGEGKFKVGRGQGGDSDARVT